MTKEERAEKAASYKNQGICNCCQAVLMVYEDSIENDSMTLETAAAGFSAGMGCMESTCGALIGAVLIAGTKTGGAPGTAKYSKQILNLFKEKSGATICKDLKGIETGKVLCPCGDCLKNAVLSLEEVLPTEE